MSFLSGIVGGISSIFGGGKKEKKKPDPTPNPDIATMFNNLKLQLEGTATQQREFARVIDEGNDAQFTTAIVLIGGMVVLVGIIAATRK